MELSSSFCHQQPDELALTSILLLPMHFVHWLRKLCIPVVHQALFQALQIQVSMYGYFQLERCIWDRGMGNVVYMVCLEIRLCECPWRTSQRERQPQPEH